MKTPSLNKILKKVIFVTTLVILVFPLITVSTLYATVPSVMSYQGILKDNSGNFLTGTYSMVFKLYSASSGGSALWTETQSSISVSSGKFSVQLGSTTPISLSFNGDYWLGIQVGADSEMTPRVKLSSVGYAYVAQTVIDGFTQAQHDALSHKNVAGVKANTELIAKTNFKLDAYTAASANGMGEMAVDVFNDASGISSGASSDYTWRGSSNYDVVINSSADVDSNTVLMLHGNGTDASTTFTDVSSGTKTVTAVGNAQIDTAQKKFGTASALFDGTGDYLTLGDSADWDFGTADFTIDYWVRFNSLASQWQDMVDNGGYSSGVRLEYDSSGHIFTVYVVNTAYNFSWTPSTNTWYHVAVVRNGNNLKVFINGSQIGSTADVTGKNITGLTLGVTVGDKTSPGLPLDGWLDELRISKGIARWTSNFTAPSAEYTSPAASATVVSVAYPQSSAPTETMVIPSETLGTGTITYYVSRDNGSTWTACTKSTVTSISAQPSGTQLKWKAVITGDAELDAIAVAV